MLYTNKWRCQNLKSTLLDSKVIAASTTSHLLRCVPGLVSHVDLYVLLSPLAIIDCTTLFYITLLYFLLFLLYSSCLTRSSYYLNNLSVPVYTTPNLGIFSYFIIKDNGKSKRKKWLNTKNFDCVSLSCILQTSPFQNKFNSACSPRGFLVTPYKMNA